jgi:hypothetical protein
MITDLLIPEPFLFNPLKHHLGYIREFINLRTDHASGEEIKDLVRELKHLGTSVTDIYTGSLSIVDICREIKCCREWWPPVPATFKIISLSDGSQWTIKYHNDEFRYVHFFPARSVRDGSRPVSAFRVKSNTLKTAVLYNILIGKDYINKNDLNKVRILLGLSPVRDTIDSEAVLEMIEILRG